MLNRVDHKKKFYNLGAWSAVFGFLNRGAVGRSVVCDSDIS